MNNQYTTSHITSNLLSKPASIINKFDHLLPGNGFIIQEDKDPYRLYYQLLKEKGDTFSWEYLETGPKNWSIKISKLKEENKSQTLGEMAVSDNRKAMILRKYGLDFSFKGKKNLREACMEMGISTRNVERELNAMGQQSLFYTINYNSWELDYLADFILANHHTYTRKILQCITDEFEKSSNNESSQILQPLFDIFNEIHTNMLYVILQEEQILFPYIRFLAHVTKGHIPANTLPAGSIQDHISKIEMEHKKLGEQMEFVRSFTRNYTKPRIEYSFYSLVLQWLNEFDNDLHQHIHIENNILFPKAIKLEQEYLNNLQLSKTVSNKLNSSIGRQSPFL